MKALTIAAGLLAGAVIVLILYNALLQRQLISINRQLEKRLRERTRQPVSLELINRELNRLAANINQCLKAEELLRLDGIREEKRFKELIANISHDLRTPLTAIRGYQQLMDTAELPDGQRRKLRTARKHADELGALIEHFFEYSYLVSAELEPVLVRMNLTNLVTECLAEAVALLEEKKLAVHIEESAPVFAYADQEMAVRIVRNLIRNCTAYSDGDVEVRIFTASQAVISFRNHVRDAEAIDVKRIFERFYTANTARSRTTGLGLFIVRLLAERQGGSASASLEDGFLEVRIGLPVYT
ncbi:HAMP domain-containing sensor histidine kinase [Paenibacillus sp. S150]|uniref:sensor histidine kinase n=1 Tax=Paenibacillus sp. S150 TaxID=2749826 RepID=UPI001C58FDC1|nr:HAMP domain-containing sensor histidine kinase [Paenibacillus sp. S150]MBW4081162.1 HAMP domain-containing histidine kinase [Paenibacillus sp. S150]